MFDYQLATLTLPCGIPVLVLKAGSNLRPKSSASASSSPSYHCSAGTSACSAVASTWADNKPLKTTIGLLYIQMVYWLLTAVLCKKSSRKWFHVNPFTNSLLHTHWAVTIVQPLCNSKWSLWTESKDLDCYKPKGYGLLKQNCIMLY